jgi:hypothetical protein
MKNIKNKVGLGLLILTAVLALSFSFSFVSAANESRDYHRFCLGDNEWIPIISGYTSYSERLACTNGRCTCNLKSGTGFCDICVYKIGEVYSPPGLGSHCDFACGHSSGGTVDAPNLTLSVLSPSNGTFSKSSFYINVETNRIASITLRDNIKGTEKTLCPNCKVYNRPGSFKYGWNNITIRAVVGAEVLEKKINFLIDNKKPRISKTTPISNKFVSNEDFTVNYDEDFLESAELHYGTIGNMRVVNLDCESGKKQTCSVKPNLSDFNGQQIDYWFVIKDIVGGQTTSRTTKIKVDKTFPIINLLNYTIKGTALKINMGVDEPNFLKATYRDNSGAEKVLCSVLSKGSCIKQLTLTRGHHTLDIQVYDKAQNSVGEQLTVDI